MTTIMISQSKANESFKHSDTVGRRSNRTMMATAFQKFHGSSDLDISARDAIILKEMLDNDCKLSSLTLSKKTDLPVTSVQRHRKRIEGTLIKMTSSPQYRAFGLMEIVVDIGTEGGLSGHVITELRDFPNVVYLARLHGDSHISLRVKIVVKSNRELAHWLDRIKAIEGVKEASWTEVIEEIPHKADLMRLLNLTAALREDRSKDRATKLLTQTSYG
jgi:DNA-binding Lrp family transcriptional regulator